MNYAEVYCRQLDRQEFQKKRRVTRRRDWLITLTLGAAFLALALFWPRPRGLPEGCVRLNLPNPSYEAFVCHAQN